MNVNLKKLLYSFYDYCDELDRDGIGIKYTAPSANRSTREYIEIYLLDFFMYLSASDGKIATKEAEFIRECLAFDYSVSEIYERIKKYNLYSEEFEKNIPLTITAIVESDNYLNNHNGSAHIDKPDMPRSKLLVRLYERLGQELLACDDDISENETRDLAIYIGNLTEYINQNLEWGVNSASPAPAAGNDDEESLDDLLDELNSLTGLGAVKQDINSLINLVRIRKLREDKGLKQTPMSLHLVFSGNPGTGKTTVARLLSKIYHKLGVLSKGQLIEVDRSKLVSQYIGKTAIQVQETVQSAIGGILFIDEAYTLTRDTSGQDFGPEAVDTLLKCMEDNRDNFIVIVAGYPQLMEEFLASNPGLRSRFNKFIHFVDYEPDEMVNIFKTMCEKSEYILDDDCVEYVRQFFTKRYMNRDSTFANGRDVRNFFEKAVVNQANRLSTKSNLSNIDLSEILIDDINSIVL